MDADDKPVAFARAIVSAVDDFSQAVAYAGADGCFALDVRADARLTLSVQAALGFADTRSLTSQDTEGALPSLRRARSRAVRARSTQGQRLPDGFWRL